MAIYSFTWPAARFLVQGIITTFLSGMGFLLMTIVVDLAKRYCREHEEREQAKIVETILRSDNLLPWSSKDVLLSARGPSSLNWRGSVPTGVRLFHDYKRSGGFLGFNRSHYKGQSAANSRDPALHLFQSRLNMSRLDMSMRPREASSSLTLEELKPEDRNTPENELNESGVRRPRSCSVGPQTASRITETSPHGSPRKRPPAVRPWEKTCPRVNSRSPRKQSTNRGLNQHEMCKRVLVQYPFILPYLKENVMKQLHSGSLLSGNNENSESGEPHGSSKITGESKRVESSGSLKIGKIKTSQHLPIHGGTDRHEGKTKMTKSCKQSLNTPVPAHDVYLVAGASPRNGNEFRYQASRKHCRSLSPPEILKRKVNGRSRSASDEGLKRQPCASTTKVSYQENGTFPARSKSAMAIDLVAITRIPQSEAKQVEFATKTFKKSSSNLLPPKPYHRPSGFNGMSSGSSRNLRASEQKIQRPALSFLTPQMHKIREVLPAFNKQRSNTQERRKTGTSLALTTNQTPGALKQGKGTGKKSFNTVKEEVAQEKNDSSVVDGIAKVSSNTVKIASVHSTIREEENSQSLQDIGELADIATEAGVFEAPRTDTPSVVSEKSTTVRKNDKVKFISKKGQKSIEPSENERQGKKQGPQPLSKPQSGEQRTPSKQMPNLVKLAPFGVPRRRMSAGVFVGQYSKNHKLNESPSPLHTLRGKDQSLSTQKGHKLKHGSQTKNRVKTTYKEKPAQIIKKQSQSRSPPRGHLPEFSNHKMITLKMDNSDSKITAGAVTEVAAEHTENHGFKDGHLENHTEGCLGHTDLPNTGMGEKTILNPPVATANIFNEYDMKNANSPAPQRVHIFSSSVNSATTFETVHKKDRQNSELSLNPIVSPFPSHSNTAVASELTFCSTQSNELCGSTKQPFGERPMKIHGMNNARRGESQEKPRRSQMRVAKTVNTGKLNAATASKDLQIKVETITKSGKKRSRVPVAKNKNKYHQVTISALKQDRNDFRPRDKETAKNKERRSLSKIVETPTRKSLSEKETRSLDRSRFFKWQKSQGDVPGNLPSALLSSPPNGGFKKQSRKKLNGNSPEQRSPVRTPIMSECGTELRKGIQEKAKLHKSSATLVSASSTKPLDIIEETHSNSNCKKEASSGHLFKDIKKQSTVFLNKSALDEVVKSLQKVPQLSAYSSVAKVEYIPLPFSETGERSQKIVNSFERKYPPMQPEGKEVLANVNEFLKPNTKSPPAAELVPKEEDNISRTTIGLWGSKLSNENPRVHQYIALSPVAPTSEQLKNKWPQFSPRAPGANTDSVFGSCASFNVTSFESVASVSSDTLVKPNNAKELDFGTYRTTQASD